MRSRAETAAPHAAPTPGQVCGAGLHGSARAAYEHAAPASGGRALLAATLGAAQAVHALGAEGDEVGHVGLGADEVDHGCCGGILGQWLRCRDGQHTGYIHTEVFCTVKYGKYNQFISTPSKEPSLARDTLAASVFS